VWESNIHLAFVEFCKNAPEKSVLELLTITEQDENDKEEAVNKATSSNAAHRLDGRVHDFVPVLTGQDLQFSVQ
jgi:hypothetical protein